MELLKIRTFFLLLVFATSLSQCKPKSDSEEETLLLLAAAASARTCANTSFVGTTVVNSTATLNASTDCITGMTSSMSADLPAWIRNNFKCAVGSVSGSNYVFRAQNIPNNKSYYFGPSSPMYLALGAGKTPAGNNQIASQCFVYSIPSAPAEKMGAKTGTQSGYASVGITVNGLAIFNNAAAPGDVLASEVSTFDTFNGHPQTSGVYHHHSQPLNVSTDNANLIGVLLDGFPVYGLKCDNNTANPADDDTPGVIGPGLDGNHGHIAPTLLFPGGIYHYHYANDTTAQTNTLIGSFFHGTPGTISN
ncbi:YHYH protein [Leptospira sp. 201903074]|uniref:YHYH protein n=1 Tax=Leptospira abararensis TaxID=2810036 RepID=UPI0019641780|nr:YHYH protein [Leptospira abararensis]MBM9546530.1 YHYH protein [Leptospira abararensis]